MTTTGNSGGATPCGATTTMTSASSLGGGPIGFGSILSATATPRHSLPIPTTTICALLAQLVEMQMDMQEMRSALDREALTRMSRSSYDRDREERLADVVERLRARVEALEKAKQ